MGWWDLGAEGVRVYEEVGLGFFGVGCVGGRVRKASRVRFMVGGNC